MEAASGRLFVYMDSSAIYGQANDLTNYGQQQAQNYQGQYNQNMGQQQQAQSNLQNYQQGMGNLGDAYQQNLQGAESSMGYNPAQLQQAQQALATTQTTMANLPNAIQQQANGRMLTNAQEAGRYAQMAGNINNLLTGQTNAVNVNQSSLANAQNQANQQTGFEGQSQQLNLGALQNLVANAQAQENTAAQQMQYFNGLRAQGIQLTIGEQTAEAQAAQAYAQAAAANQQTKMYAAQAALAQTQNQQAQTAALPQNSTQGQQLQNYGNPAVNYGVLGSIDNGLQSAWNSPYNPINPSSWTNALGIK